MKRHEVTCQCKWHLKSHMRVDLQWENYDYIKEEIGVSTSHKPDTLIVLERWETKRVKKAQSKNIIRKK